MAELTPQKSDINAIFKRLRSIPTNKQCFDCRANNPTWASVTYGVFLCIDCSAVHRSLGVHLTFIRSTQLDTNWTWLQLRAMQAGGNQAATNFFRQHGCTTDDAQQKYNSRAAHMYREKLHSLASRAMQTHGTKTHIQTHEDHISPPATQKEVDFFKEHHENFEMRGEAHATAEESLAPSHPVPVTNGKARPVAELIEEDGVGPSVEHVLGTSPTMAIAQAEPRKATIGARKPAAKKGGLGGRKGLGAQKVKTDFSSLESDAQRRDKDREQFAANQAVQQAKDVEDSEKRMASMRLAYQDMTAERKKQEAKMKDLDPKKREQMERLGMGLSGPRVQSTMSVGATHSVMSDMTMIEQETPTQEKHDRYSRQRNDFDDEFEIVSNSFSGPPKYNDSPFGMKREDRYSSWGNDKKSSWDMDRFESNSSSSFIEDIPHKKEDDDRGRSRKNYEISSSTDAQKKFGNAKAISSDAYFGNRDPDFETRQSLQRFEGQSSISSADLFGNGQPRPTRQEGPDLAEIKEGVRQGVTKVAGKLSSLANGVITSIQDNYS